MRAWPLMEAPASGSSRVYVGFTSNARQGTYTGTVAVSPTRRPITTSCAPPTNSTANQAAGSALSTREAEPAAVNYDQNVCGSILSATVIIPANAPE